MPEEEVLAIFQKVGAFRTGHFVFTSGMHSDTYINKDALYAHTEETSLLCEAMAKRFAKSNVEAVIGPAIGAALLAQWTAYHLSKITGREVYAAYAHKDGSEGNFVIKRGFDDVIKGMKTLVVEDLTTTGGSLKRVVERAREVGAHVIGAIALCNRGGVTRAGVGNPPAFEALLNVHLDQWAEADCDLCKRGIPVNTNVGHGREFLARHQKSQHVS